LTLQSTAQGFPFEEYGSSELSSRRHRRGALLSSRCTRLQSLEDASTWRSYGFECSRLELRSLVLARDRLLAVFRSGCPAVHPGVESDPLVSLVSRSECDPLSLAASLRRLTAPSLRCDPPLRFAALQRSQKWTATNTRFALPGCATPSGFLSLSTFHSVHDPSGLVSCQSRSWAWSLRGFPSPIAARASHLRLAAPASRLALPSVSSLHPAHIRRYVRARLAVTSRVCALGESVLRGPVLPGVHGSILSQTCLSEVSSLRPWLRASTGPPLMGFGTSLDGCPPVVVPALQSVNEPRG